MATLVASLKSLTSTWIFAFRDINKKVVTYKNMKCRVPDENLNGCRLSRLLIYFCMVLQREEMSALLMWSPTPLLSAVLGWKWDLEKY